MPQNIQLVLALLSDGEGEEPEAAGEGTRMRAAKRHDESPVTDGLSMGGAGVGGAKPGDTPYPDCAEHARHKQKGGAVARSPWVG